MGNAVQVTDDSFQQTVSQQGLVLVDFYADWCGPCRIVSPILEQLAAEEPRLTVAKLDVDANQRTAMRFGVMSIPTLVLFKDGKPIDMMVGAAPKATLKGWIEEHLASA